jgi:predicted PhzF superfamily epimerase YddE/YHI9
MATKKLTDKQINKIDEIAKAFGLGELDAIKAIDVKGIKTIRKEIAAQLKAVDKILAIIAPAKKEA